MFKITDNLGSMPCFGFEYIQWYSIMLKKFRSYSTVDFIIKLKWTVMQLLMWWLSKYTFNNEHWIKRSRTWIYYSIVVILIFCSYVSFQFRLNTDMFSFVIKIFYALPSSKWTSDHPVKLVIFLTVPLYSGIVMSEYRLDQLNEKKELFIKLIIGEKKIGWFPNLSWVRWLPQKWICLIW